MIKRHIKALCLALIVGTLMTAWQNFTIGCAAGIGILNVYGISLFWKLSRPEEKPKESEFLRRMKNFKKPFGDDDPPDDCSAPNPKSPSPTLMGGNAKELPKRSD